MKFAKKEAIASTAKPTEVNLMGEAAYKLNPKEELVSTVLTTFVNKSYYESEKEIIDRIKKAALVCDPEFVAKTAIYTREEANMRSASHLLAGELADRVNGKSWAANFYNKILVRPDDMSEILAYYFDFKAEKNANGKFKISNPIKKGFRKKLESMDAYLIDKYKMAKRNVSLIDLVNLFKPKPTQKNEEAFRRLLKGESLEGLYSTKILEKEKSRAGQGLTTAAEKAEAKSKAITETLESNKEDNPVMNTLRNLVSVLENAPDQVDLVCEILTNREKIKKSRLLPFRFATAYAEVDSTGPSKTSSVVKFEKENKVDLKEKVLYALEIAMNISCENIPVLQGNTAILIDHSGSVRGDGGGASKVSAFSKTTTANIGNLFGCMLMQTQGNVFMGLFGDKLITVDTIDRKKGILKNNQDIYKLGEKCGGSTEQGIYDFFEDVVKNKVRVDNVIIFSDMVIGKENWYGRKTGTGSGSFQHLFKKFKAMNPQANVVTIDIKQTGGTSVFDKSLGVTQVSGWSDKVFDVLKTMGKGYEEIIAQIEKIKL